MEIKLENGWKLVARKDAEPYDNEIFIGIVDEKGRTVQNIAVVRPNDVCETIEVLLWEDEKDDDMTQMVEIPLLGRDSNF